MRHDADGNFFQWTGDPVLLNACFVASLVTARLYLNVLGLGKGNAATPLVPYRAQPDDATAGDLAGKCVDIATIPLADQRKLRSFIVMADKAAAHFTVPHPHDRKPIPEVIRLIHGYLKTNLYDPTGRSGLEAL